MKEDQKFYHECENRKAIVEDRSGKYCKVKRRFGKIGRFLFHTKVIGQTYLKFKKGEIKKVKEI